MIKIYSEEKKNYGKGPIFIQGMEYKPQEINQYDQEESRGAIRFEGQSKNYDSRNNLEARRISQDEDPKNDLLFDEDAMEFEMPLEMMGQDISNIKPINSDLEGLENKWYRRFLKAME